MPSECETQITQPNQLEKLFCRHESESETSPHLFPQNFVLANNFYVVLSSPPEIHVLLRQSTTLKIKLLLASSYANYIKLATKPVKIDAMMKFSARIFSSACSIKQNTQIPVNAN